MALSGHSFLVAGTAEAVEPLLGYLEKEQLLSRGSADVYARAYTFFGAGDARELRDRAALSAHGIRRVFIIAAPTMSVEAQNALLKTLEEPPRGTLFFIIVPSPSALLPTSRRSISRTNRAHR
jgi:DNA polymerase III delta prime subunit